MPSLPTYNSRSNIRANTVAPLREGEAQRDAQPLQQVIGATGEFAQKVSDANDVMQYTEARAIHSTSLANLEARAKADPDFKNSDKYTKELYEIKKTSVSGISNQRLAAKASYEFGAESNIIQNRITTDFNDKRIAYTRVLAKNEIDGYLKEKLSYPEGSKEAQYYTDKIESTLYDNVVAGVFDAKTADTMLKESQETAVKYNVYNDNSTQEKDSQVLADLKNPKGKYSFLPPDDRLKLIEESQRRIFQNNQTMKREAEFSRDGRFNDIFTKANDGTLTLNDLDQEMKIPEDQGGIPKKQILDIRKAMQSRIKTDLQVIVDNSEKAGEYASFVDNFISDETDRQKGREAIVNAYKDGILSPKEASFLNSLKREAEGIKSIKSREEFMGNNMIPFKNAINAVNDFFTGKKNFTESDKALAIKNLLNGSADGVDPKEASQTVIKQAIINSNPSILNFNPDGQIVLDENGNVRMMNNFGDYWNPEESFKKSQGAK